MPQQLSSLQNCARGQVSGFFSAPNFDSLEGRADALDTDLINRLNIGQGLAYLIRYNFQLNNMLAKHYRMQGKTNEFQFVYYQN